MEQEDVIRSAARLFQEAFEAQMDGDLDEATRLYKESIATYPTAEAHTFLGWAYSFSGDLEEAIAECKNAIAVDPDFGNPYNDIGAYLIQMERFDDAIPWLEHATRAARYESPHYPRINLGRVFAAKQMYARALREFERALELEPGNTTARQAAATLRSQLN